MRRSPEGVPAIRRGRRSATPHALDSARIAPADRPLVIGCGALARELVALTRRAGFPEVDLTLLPATLHNRPERIPAAVQARIRRARAAGRDRIFVAYADCGTGGLLDRVLEEEGIARLEGAHCYEVYAGRAAFAELADAEPGTFYLTDFLARNFERLVVRGLGLDRHPELLPLYFGNYTRLLYLAQTDDPALTTLARRGARRLGLRFERRAVGYGELEPAMTALGPQASDDGESTIRARDVEPDRQGRDSMTPSRRIVPGKAPATGLGGGTAPRKDATHRTSTARRQGSVPSPAATPGVA